MDVISKETKNINSYSPSAIINIFNNSISVGEEKKIITIEGIYLRQNSKEYNGYYYDKIKDTYSDKSLTLVVPKILRNTINQEYIYLFSGYLSRKISDAGNIQINFCVTSIWTDNIKVNNELENKAIEIRNKKSLKNYKSFNLVIETKLLAGHKPTLALILGNNAIVKDDIFNILGSDIAYYDIDEYRINLSSKEEIINKISEIDKGSKYDALIISRGGGTGLEIFNNIEIVEYLSTINTILVTAIGHATDFTYLQNVSDYNFDTPTALGSYLKNFSQKIIGLYNTFNIDKASWKIQMNTIVEQKDKEFKELGINISQKNTELSKLKKSQYIKVIFLVVIAIVLWLLKK